MDMLTYNIIISARNMFNKSMSIELDHAITVEQDMMNKYFTFVDSVYED